MIATRLVSCLALLVISYSVNAQTVCGDLKVLLGVRYIVIGKTDTFWAKPSDPKMKMRKAGGSSRSSSNQTASTVEVQESQPTVLTVVVNEVDTIVNHSTVVIDEPPTVDIEALEAQLEAAKKQKKLRKKLARKKKRAKKREERNDSDDDRERSGWFLNLLLKFLIGLGIAILAPFAIALGLAGGFGWLLWRLGKVMARPFKKCDCGNSEPRSRKERLEVGKDEELKVLSRHGRRVKSSRIRRYKKVRGKHKKRCVQAEE